jgi:hypothetical protein
MHALGPARFFDLIWRERKQLAQFLAWTAERRRVQGRDGLL